MFLGPRRRQLCRNAGVIIWQSVALITSSSIFSGSGCHTVHILLSRVILLHDLSWAGNFHHWLCYEFYEWLQLLLMIMRKHLPHANLPSPPPSPLPPLRSRMAQFIRILYFLGKRAYLLDIKTRGNTERIFFVGGNSLYVTPANQLKEAAKDSYVPLHFLVTIQHGCYN